MWTNYPFQTQRRPAILAPPRQNNTYRWWGGRVTPGGLQVKLLSDARQHLQCTRAQNQSPRNDRVRCLGSFAENGMGGMPSYRCRLIPAVSKRRRPQPPARYRVRRGSGTKARSTRRQVSSFTKTHSQERGDAVVLLARIHMPAPVAMRAMIRVELRSQGRRAHSTSVAPAIYYSLACTFLFFYILSGPRAVCLCVTLEGSRGDASAERG